MNAPSPFVPVIPAGGSGTRLWPLSRKSHPKFLLDLLGTGESLLQATVGRLAPLADRQPIVVTGFLHRDAVQAQVGEHARILAEPTPRNSMPAIAWAAALAMKDDPEAIIGSFAADHVISPDDEFHAVVRSTIAVAELGYLATIGIEPTFPATGFGYIETVEGVGPKAEALAAAGGVSVARFVEKPNEERAREFLAEGTFKWNAGMFVVKARVLLEALDALLPAVSAGARTLVEADVSRADIDLSVWESMTAIAIDHALAEPLASQGKVATVPASFRWDDVGDFLALGELLRERGADSPDVYRSAAGTGDVVSLGGARVAALDSTAQVYSHASRPIALIGVEGISVVETDEALVIVHDDHAQKLSAFVKSLPENGLGDLA